MCAQRDSHVAACDNDLVCVDVSAEIFFVCHRKELPPRLDQASVVGIVLAQWRPAPRGPLPSSPLLS